MNEKPTLVLFRHQLWLEHVDVLEETIIHGYHAFILADHALPSWVLGNLVRICKFSVSMLYCDGNKRLCILLCKDL